MKKQIIIGLMSLGLVAGCSTPKTEYSSLPSAVKDTIQRQCPNAQVASVETAKHDGCCVYKVKFCPSGKMEVYPNGTIAGS